MRSYAGSILRCYAFAQPARLTSAVLVVLVWLSLSWLQPVQAQEPAPRAAVRATKQHIQRRVPSDNLVATNSIPTLVVSTNGRLREYIEPQGRGSVAGTGACGEVTHTDPSNFEGGVYNIQAGFAEGEAAIASYDVNPDDYPIRIESMECVFAQDTTVATITQWRVIVWDGPPYPENVHSLYDSDDVILPHLSMPAGLRGTNIKVVVDPEDPEPIILTNESGANKFSVGFAILKHNDGPQNPCAAIDDERNAFPTTDADGVATLTGNWLSALICGYLCDGLNQFQDLLPLPPPLGCRPSGDWIIRATYQCSLSGACCDVDANCTDAVNGADCTQQGGTFMGANVFCSEITCPTPVGACCVSGVCLDDLTEEVCGSLTNAFYMGNGTPCDSLLCALGACCMADGSCEDLMEVECDAAGGAFEGGGTECATTECPQPRGSCCIEGICIPSQTQVNCEALGTWNGPDSTCDPDPCTPSCPDVAIVEASPPEGTVDARQSHEPASALPRQGIGSASDPIVLTLGVGGLEHCFTLCETAADLDLGANEIATVTDLGGGIYEMVLLRPITPGAATTIRYEGSGEFVTYYSHPANVNGDSLADADDVSQLVGFLDGQIGAHHGMYSVDVDHSGTVTPADLLRLIDLLNGADSFDAWNGTLFPVNTSCP